MLVPAIIALYAPNLTKKAIIIIVIANGLCVYIVLSAFIVFVFDGQVGTTAPMALWSFVNYKLLSKRCMPKNNTALNNTVTFQNVSNAPIEAPMAKQQEEFVSDITTEEEPKKDVITKYESAKPSSNVWNKSLVITIIALLLFIIFLMLCYIFVQNKKIESLQKDNATHSSTNSGEYVCVSESGSKYHTRICNFVTGGIFEIKEILLEDAIANGYTACECYAETASNNFDDTWSDLIDSNNGKDTSDTTTKEQRYANYPSVNRDKVYYVPNGETYHSVGWCYTLKDLKTINNCTYDVAISLDLKPCSTCVGH
jgi:flagellar basal body-associated protein FliL